MNSGFTVLSATEKLFYLWKMFFLHVRLSGVHESFNSVSPSGSGVIDCRFMSYPVWRGNWFFVFIDLYCPAFFQKPGSDLERMPSIGKRLIL